MSDADRDPKEDLLHTAGTSLAAFGLLVNTLRLLQQKGLLEQREVHLLVQTTLATLEQADLVTQPEIHAARTVLGGIAQSLGVPLRRPS